MMILIQLNDEDEDDGAEKDDDDGDVDYLGVQSVTKMCEAGGSVGQPLY